MNANTLETSGITITNAGVRENTGWVRYVEFEYDGNLYFGYLSRDGLAELEFEDTQGNTLDELLPSGNLASTLEALILDATDSW